MSKSIYVVAHNGHCEGHSLPMLAFHDRATAFKWCDCQDGSFSVAEVPIFPELPSGPYYSLKAEDPNARAEQEAEAMRSDNAELTL